MPQGYPKVKTTSNKYDTLFDIYLNDIKSDIELDINFGNCIKIDDHLYSSLRTLSITTSQPTFYQAYHKIYQNCNKIVVRLHFRTDIGDLHLS